MTSLHLISREPRLYKRVCPSVGPSVGPLVMLLSAGRLEPANDFFRVLDLCDSFVELSGMSLTRKMSRTRRK